VGCGSATALYSASRDPSPEQVRAADPTSWATVLIAAGGRYTAGGGRKARPRVAPTGRAGDVQTWVSHRAQPGQLARWLAGSLGYCAAARPNETRQQSSSICCLKITPPPYSPRRAEPWRASRPLARR